MAQPSSSHREHRDRDREVRERERERDRDRERRSSRSHHHHRTISSTTLLLVLSLVLAVLAVMLSLPSNELPPVGGVNSGDPNAEPPKGVWGILTPKRSQQLVQREGQVAVREADVARREAELLAGAPGGVLPPPPPPPVVCPLCPTIAATTITITPEPAPTVFKEVVRETELTPPGWFKEGQLRFEDILDRELKIAEREREIGRREESVNRREHDASRREGWIMEQLIALGNEEASVEEEHVYDAPRRPLQRPPNKYLPIEQDLPPLIYTETAIATEYKTVTKTQHHTHTQPSIVTMPAPANTRLAAFPTPQPVTVSYSTGIPKTTAVQYITEDIVEEAAPVVEEIIEEEEEVLAPVTKVRARGPVSRPPKRWMGGW